MPAPIDQEYRVRLDARRRTLADRERAQVRLSNVRLAIAGAAVVMLIVLGWRAGGPLLVIPFALFVVAAIVHARLLNDRDRAQSAVSFYERGLARLAHDWIGRGSDGERFRQPDHPFADDLDLFGRGSAFELLSTARTRAGEDVLASWLLHPAPPDEIRSRQGAVADLAPRIDLRESIAVLGDGLRVGVDAPLLRAWATGPHRLGQPGVRVALLILSAVTGTLLAWWWFGPEPPVNVVRAAIILAAIEALVALWYRPFVHHVVVAVDPASRDLELLAGVLRTIERERFTSERLSAFHDALGGHDRPASTEIAYLAQLVALLRSRQNMMFALPAALVMWTTQVSHAIEAWRRRVGHHVPDWLRVVGEFEALVALGTYASEHPDYAVPELAPATDTARLAGTAIAHPLLSDNAVANDIAIGGGAPVLYIVSGSNMSGKSTFLRAIGLNAVLAQMGAPVRARSFTLSPVVVGASIRIQDSLQDGRSRFFAEITRLKQIVDLATTHRHGALFLLDEILAGTNSHDRRHGAEALLVGLTNLGAIGLATTHDLALGEIVHRLDSRAANVHFEDSFVDGVLTFDYRLREGVVRTSNALPLMRSIGLEV